MRGVSDAGPGPGTVEAQGRANALQSEPIKGFYDHEKMKRMWLEGEERSMNSPTTSAIRRKPEISSFPGPSKTIFPRKNALRPYCLGPAKPRVAYPNRKPIPIREIPVNKAEPDLDWSILDRLNRSIRSPTADDLNIPMHSRSPSPPADDLNLLEAVTSLEGPSTSSEDPITLESLTPEFYDFSDDLDESLNTKNPENSKISNVDLKNSQKSNPTNIADALQNVLTNTYEKSSFTPNCEHF
ncbi:hypothetical protein B9Z55_003618 [Caenorhabditis nigoni]|uniref:Uncharacterized protein n=1 Tax=Caenorhabditis nigoni TaxID=1611254 RepID=A0A2G5VRC3_9PELO|nr:hypothetical protein B9Z55_003618 [Caenorhabditis nigoni]